MAQECDYRKADGMYNDGSYVDALEIFEELAEYSDSAARAQQCVYAYAETLYAAGDYAGAESLYASITYEDSEQKVQLCVYRRAKALYAAGNYEAARELFASIEYEDSAEKASLSAYKAAEADFKAGNYQNALNTLEGIRDYDDSGALIEQCHNMIGSSKISSGDMDGAVAEFALATSIPEARDALMSVAKDYAAINETEKAIQALWVLRNEEPARALLAEIGDLKALAGETDKALLAACAIGESALADKPELIDQDKYGALVDVLASCDLLPGELCFVEAIRYSFASSALDFREYELAESVFNELGEYRDASTQVQESQYQKAQALLTAGVYDEATAIFNSINGYRDAATQTQESQYQKGAALLAARKYDGAMEVFKSISEYSDAAKRVLECQYAKGVFLQEQGKVPQTLAVFRTLGRDYEDAGMRLDALYKQLADYAARISTSSDYTVGLKSDGSVVAVGDNGRGQCDVSDWRDIVAVSAGLRHTVG